MFSFGTGPLGPAYLSASSLTRNLSDDNSCFFPATQAAIALGLFAEEYTGQNAIERVAESVHGLSGVRDRRQHTETSALQVRLL